MTIQLRGIIQLIRGEYRWGRNRKKAEDELLAKRETMHGRQKRGRDYTPLFYFLVKQIGQPWDKVFSEVCGRLDTTEPVFWLVALHEHQKRDLVRIGDSSFYPGLFVDGNGILQQVNPSITGKDVKVICRCCTHTYMGEPVPGSMSNITCYPAPDEPSISAEQFSYFDREQ